MKNEIRETLNGECLMDNMKKMCLIVNREEYYGITLFVDKDFDEDWDSPILKGVLKDFPIQERRTIIKGETIEIINEGDEIKVNPQYYLNKSGHLENLNNI